MQDRKMRKYALNSTVKQILIWVFMIACLIFLWQFVVKGTGTTQDKNISLTTLLNDADAGKISEVNVNGLEVIAKYRGDDKTQFHTTIPAGYNDLYNTLRSHGVNIMI